MYNIILLVRRSSLHFSMTPSLIGVELAKKVVETETVKVEVKVELGGSMEEGRQARRPPL